MTLNTNAHLETHLRLLNEVSDTLQNLMDSDSFYQGVVNLIHSKFKYYSVQIWVVDEDKSKATLRAQTGAYGSHLRIGHHLFAPIPGITGHVIRTGKAYLSNDVTNDPNFTTLSLPIESQSELCIPILKEERVIATLNIESDRADEFHEEDFVTLQAVASQLSIVITNRNYYREIKGFNEKLRMSVEEKSRELQRAGDVLSRRENRTVNTLGQEKVNIIGGSPAIRGILTMVDKIAPTMASVLIEGESGTGKELIARRLHQESLRANRPYVTVNCGALQESLLESELFGHEKGAFTGAFTQKIGLAETADGGTIFLDEIGEMSPAIQTKLLRFLQEGEFYRIGGKRPIRVNVRVLSATNRDLTKEVKEGRFREDLFYRLNTIAIKMPPLRNRKEDLGLLVDFFLKNSRFGDTADGRVKRIDPTVVESFRNYDWPGNIRELQNTVERLKILSEGPEIRLSDVPRNIRSPENNADQGENSVDMPLAEIERRHILRALSYYNGNKTKTAQSLGITIKTLYNKLHRYGILQRDPGLTTELNPPDETSHLKEV